jgi:uncharacterized protein YkwD
MPAAASAARRFRSLAALAAAATAFTVGAPAAQAAPTCANQNANPNDISAQQARDATLCLLNNERRSRGIRPLKDNSRLDLASQRHANDMSAHNYFAHGDFVGRIRSVRYLKNARGWTVGENIAWGSWDFASPAAIVNGWMHSPGHKANILNGGFHEIGLGVARGAPEKGQQHAGTYVTDFGTRF